MRTATILFLVATSACWSSGLAQSQNQTQNPDLTGSWKLDETNKSDKHSRAVRQITALEMSQHEPELRMRETIKEKGTERTEEVLYYTDGRGEVNLLPSFAAGQGKDKIQSHTKWDKGRLVIKYSQVWHMASDTMYFDVEETWELAKNQNELIHTKQLQNPQSAFHKSLVMPEVLEKTTWVYNRVPSNVSK